MFFYQKNMENTTRSNIKKIIENGNVKINEKIIKLPPKKVKRLHESINLIELEKNQKNYYQ